MDPLGGAADERHLGFGQSAVEIPAHERKLGAEQRDAAVFYWEEPDQLVGRAQVPSQRCEINFDWHCSLLPSHDVAKVRCRLARS